MNVSTTKKHSLYVLFILIEEGMRTIFSRMTVHTQKHHGCYGVYLYTFF